MVNPGVQAAVTPGCPSPDSRPEPGLSELPSLSCTSLGFFLNFSAAEINFDL